MLQDVRLAKYHYVNVTNHRPKALFSSRYERCVSDVTTGKSSSFEQFHYFARMFNAFERTLI